MATTKKRTRAATTKKPTGAEIPTAGLIARVRAIDWDGVSGGQAKGFAEAFAAIAAGGKKASVKAFERARCLLGDKGRTNPIAGLAIPFLVELLAALPRHRAALLVYLADAAMFGHAQWVECGFDRDTTGAGLLSTRARARIYEAFAAGEATYLVLLADAEPGVRAAAAFALAWVRTSATRTTHARLFEAFERETDPPVRASLALALALSSRTPDASDLGSVAPRLLAGLAAKDPSERLALAIACSLLPDAAGDPRVAAALLAPDDAIAPTPWCGGNLRTLARRRALALAFGEPPDERPSTTPPLNDAQRALLRSLLGDETPRDVSDFVKQLGLPADDAALRRLVGVARHVPAGKHGAIYDRWMTWDEAGGPPAALIAAELLADVKPDDVVEVLELMYYAEQDHKAEIADWQPPELPGAVPPPGEPDHQYPGCTYRYYPSPVDECVRAYEARLRAEGYTTWAHGHDGPNDLNQGDVVGWHPEGREIRTCFDRRDALTRARYEWQRTLVRALTRAAIARDGIGSVLAGLRRVGRDDVRRAIGLIRVGWEIAEVTGTPTDPVCDDFALAAGQGRHYIYWVARAHLERLDSERRTRLVLRLLAADSDNVFGWVRFAPGSEVEREATKMLHRAFETQEMSYYDLEQAAQAAERMLPYVDEALRARFVRMVAADENPVVQTLVLARLGHLDAVRPALKSEYPMARAAARRALDVG